MMTPVATSGRSKTHALAIARWEKNRKGWLEGDFLGLASRDRYLQDLVGDGGTLWIIVSRRKPDGGRLMSLAFRLENCKSRTYPEKGQFGKYAVVGNPHASTLFAVNDARYLLMSLRFEPFRPIRNASVIGQSIQRPRRLNPDDVKLLEDYKVETDRWSVFISYQREGEERLAIQLADFLRRSGIPAFLDQDILRVGQQWKTSILNAVRRSRTFILLIGKNTHRSREVQSELREALNRRIRVIPLIVGGTLEQWTDFRQLSDYQAIKKSDYSRQDFFSKVVDGVRSDL